jgi:hypothetical protein
VLEYFTNADTEDCERTDTLVRNLIEKVPADVIDIQYHYDPRGDMPDSLYHDYPIPPNNRGTVYGISKIPMAILNGGSEEGLGYHLIYNFSTSSESPSVEDIQLRSHTEPDFKPATVVNFAYKRLEISTDVGALKDLTCRNVYLYAMVIQRLIEDQAYIGTNATTKFYNVAR